MCNYHYIHVLFLAAVLSTLHIQVRAQGFLYSTYTNPYQNSFAFTTPNLKQMFTTKLSTPPHTQQTQFQNQQFTQQNTFTFPENYQQGNNFFPTQSQIYSTAPQQFPNLNNEQLGQLAYLHQQQQQQQQEQRFQQQLLLQQQFFQQREPAFQQQISRDENQVNLEQKDEVAKTQNLLGVAFSPSTKVSQVRFEGGKLKYDF